MKTVLSLITILVWAPMAQALYVQTTPVNEPIPDGDLAGLASTLLVSGQPTSMWDVSVALNISGTCNGDLYSYLTHASGFAVLLNRPGRTAVDSLGYSDDGLNIQLSDSAPVDIHNYGGNGGNLLSGTFQPDGRRVLPTLVLDTTPRTAMLSSFDGLNPNGEWTLFVADAEGGDLHQLVSWEIEFTPVPEPTTLACIPLMLLGVLARLSWRRK